jgi:hypothetical protein
MTMPAMCPAGSSFGISASWACLACSRSRANRLSETIIFMAPTVIDPSAENQPHSAFRTRLRRKMQEASEADTTVDDGSQS